MTEKLLCDMEIIMGLTAVLEEHRLELVVHNLKSRVRK